MPNAELEFPHDRRPLENTVVVRLRERSLRVGSLELQIASRRRMGARTDLEDAPYRYHRLASARHLEDERPALDTVERNRLDD